MHIKKKVIGFPKLLWLDVPTLTQRGTHTYLQLQRLILPVHSVPFTQMKDWQAVLEADQL